jgi:hypothetical protein
MLHNTREFLAPIDACLMMLKSAEVSFFLTGSRFFGGVHSKSDWDFIAQHNEITEAFLLSIGFKLNEDVQDYLDPMTTKVLTKHFCSCESRWRYDDEGVVMRFDEHRFQHSDECLKIDIQLCHDVTTKLQIRDILKKGFDSKPLPGDKYQRNRLWTMVYNLVKTST